MDDPLRALMVTGDVDEWGYAYRMQNLVQYTVTDVGNRSSPEVEREIFVEGHYHTARLVNGTMRSKPMPTIDGLPIILNFRLTTGRSLRSNEYLE